MANGSTIVTQLIPLISALMPWIAAAAVVLMCIFCIWFGFWMGRTRDNAPMSSIRHKHVDDDNGEPMVDVFDRAMGVGMPMEDEDNRKPTV